MDSKKVKNLASQCLVALESVSVTGQHNRIQLCGVYNGLKAILAEPDEEKEAETNG